MNAMQTLLACAERGVLVSVLDDGDLWVRPKEKLTPELRAALRENKQEIVEGRRGRPSEFEISDPTPAQGWQAIFVDHSGGKGRYWMESVMCFVKVDDRDTGYQWIEPVVRHASEDWGVLARDCVAFLHLVAPEKVEEEHEEIQDWNKGTV